MPGAMDETRMFGSILKRIYTPFSALASTLTHPGVSILQGGFSPYFTAMTRTVDIYPSRFLIKGSTTPL